jgi:predicted Zn finger-like uncharacterized protein
MRLQDVAALGTCDAEMDIACPNCAATYRVPDSLVAGGKVVRCAACQQDWVPKDATLPMDVARPPPPLAAEAEPVSAEPAAEPEPPGPRAEVPILGSAGEPSVPRRAPPPTEPPPLQRRPARRPTGTRIPLFKRIARPLPLAWIASVALMLLALAGLGVFHQEIATAWPPFARISSLFAG